MTIESQHRQTYPLSPETYWQEVCLSLEFQERMYREALGCTRMEVVELNEHPERGTRRKLRFEKPLNAPAVIQKMFGSAVTIQEESVFDPAQKRWEFRMLPPLFADRIDIRGLATLEARPDGIEQRTVLRVSCRILGLGGLIEHFVSKSAEESNADKAAFTRRYIAEKSLR